MPTITNQFTPLQEAWIKTLLEGNFPQTKNRLQDDKGYCCLGVACQILENRKIFKVRKDELGFIQGHIMPSGSIDYLNLHDTEGFFKKPITVVQGYETYAEVDSLVQLNDNEGWSLRQIGGWIYRNPWQVFTNFIEPE